MQGIAELIEEFCECTEGYYFRPDYSGRFMYGRKCIATVTDKGVAVAMGELYEFLHNRGIVNITKALGSPATDDMGLKTILYFPYISKASD